MLKITHIAQMHPLNYMIGNLAKEFKNKVIESQFKITKLVQQIVQQKNQDYPVVIEEGYDDLNCENVKDRCNLVKTSFPKGLPNTFDDLSDTQKDLIHRFGSEILLLGLEIIETVYKAIDKSTSKRILAEVKNKDFSNIFDLREKKAIEFCKIAAKKHYQESSDNNEVLLVFGAAHDFAKYSSNEIMVNRIDIFTLDKHHSKEKLSASVNQHHTVNYEELFNGTDILIGGVHLDEMFPLEHEEL